uniref:Uncharacterized protein n=1 Tax=Anguilla anguilla TaxID=7936 RepID=A0A0E9QS24_ANGAN
MNLSPCGQVGLKIRCGQAHCCHIYFNAAQSVYAKTSKNLVLSHVPVVSLLF